MSFQHDMLGAAGIPALLPGHPRKPRCDAKIQPVSGRPIQ